ncbi:hypothetical protein ACFX15_024995 [Malus domestica]
MWFGMLSSVILLYETAFYIGECGFCRCKGSHEKLRNCNARSRCFLQQNRAEEAAEQATLAPLIGSSIQSATGVVYNITGGKDITLQEVNRVSQGGSRKLLLVVGAGSPFFLSPFLGLMKSANYCKFSGPSANIIFGAVVDDRYNGELRLTIIATCLSQSFQKTLLTDPEPGKLLDKVAGVRESRGIPLPPKSSTSPSTISSKPSPRKLFF